MKYVWLILNWGMAILFLSLALTFILSVPLAAIPLLLNAVLFAPPFHRFTEKNFGKQISAKPKAKLAVLLFAVFGIAMLVHTAQEQGHQLAAKAAQEKAQAEALRQQKIAAFQDKRESLIADAQKAFQEKRFEDVVLSTGSYEEMGDADLGQLGSKAKEELSAKKAVEERELSAKKAVEEREQKQRQDAARTKQILTELPKVPAQDHLRNYELYAELAKLNPQDVKAKQRLEIHQKKYEEQKEKERLAAQKAAKEASEKAAFEKKITDQFSGWDGSHRKLEAYIKTSMNDPDSYKHVQTTYSNAGTHLLVCTTFRGKNAFGGVVRNSVWAKVDFDGNILEILKYGP